MKFTKGAVTGEGRAELVEIEIDFDPEPRTEVLHFDRAKGPEFLQVGDGGDRKARVYDLFLDGNGFGRGEAIDMTLSQCEELRGWLRLEYGLAGFFSLTPK